MLKGGLLINERSGFMNLSSYRNIILTAVNLRKFEWMDRFIDEYRERLLPDQRESVSAWARSTSLYSQKKFEDALGELHKVRNDHFLTKHDIRILQMKIFYELRILIRRFLRLMLIRRWLKMTRCLPNCTRNQTGILLPFTSGLSGTYRKAG